MAKGYSSAAKRSRRLLVRQWLQEPVFKANLKASRVVLRTGILILLDWCIGEQSHISMFRSDGKYHSKKKVHV